MMATVEKWSANGVCALRAVAYLEEGSVRHEDCLAMDFVSGSNQVLATTPLLRKVAWRFYNWWIPGVYFMHIGRTRYFDARVRHGLRGGAGALVVLAAGLDSRVHRLVDDSVRCFELDLPVNSTLKQARVNHVLGESATPVQYVAADLTKPDDALARLATAGLDDEVDAVFTLEGVSMYIEYEHLSALLASLSRRAGRTHLVLDWFDKDTVKAQGRCLRTRRHFKQMARDGERYTLGLTSAMVAKMAQEHGFDVLDTVEGADVDRQWCSEGQIEHRGLGFCGMAHLRSR